MRAEHNKIYRVILLHLTTVDIHPDLWRKPVLVKDRAMVVYHASGILISETITNLTKSNIEWVWYGEIHALGTHH